MNIKENGKLIEIRIGDKKPHPALLPHVVTAVFPDRIVVKQRLSWEDDNITEYRTYFPAPEPKKEA